MREYELVYILDPNLEEEQAAGITEGVSGVVRNLKGELGEVKPWGRRKLAYPINNFREGNYIEMHFKMETSAVAELERGLRLNESVIRYLVTKKD
ncbi:MAG: 30S ribosomal protein S6 [Dehalococcoidales bacterium]|nr:30S ribosomal protein S6 [Dehalococcoidales bacterium]